MKNTIAAILILINFSCLAQSYRVKAVKSNDTAISNVAVKNHLIPLSFYPQQKGYLQYFTPEIIGVKSARIEIFSLEGKLLHSMRTKETWHGTGIPQILIVKSWWYEPICDCHKYQYHRIVEH